MNKMKWGALVRNSKHFTISQAPLYSAFPRWYSKSEKDTKVDFKNDKKQPKDDKSTDKSKEVLSKLNSLLKEMIEVPAKETSAMKLSKPIGRKSKDILASKISSEQKEHVDEKTHIVTEKVIVKAAQEVAKSLGGDTKQTESELMKKFLSNSEEDASVTTSNLSDIVKGMKIDRSQGQVQQTRSQQVKQILDQYQKQHKRPTELRRSKPKMMRKPQIMKLDNIDLFGAEPLGIFTANPAEYIEPVKNDTWEKLKEKEMKLAVTHPPSNYFQEMILWTEQGKLWKFPIDNEQGMEEEQEVSFAEHVFLEKYLEPWCPSKGPIRHFMELVCVGLSKNPYLTASAKREHIEWYQNYFEDKRQLLKEVGASLNEAKEVKNIESM